MNDFDATLRARLHQLDAAIPDPGVPAIVARRRGPNRRRQAIVLLAAAVVFLGSAAFATVANPPPPDPAVVAQNHADEERIRNDPGMNFEACLNRDQSVALIRSRLDVLGYSSWTIRNDDRIKYAPCVEGAVLGDTHEVLLIASMGGRVSDALDELEANLMTQCLGRSSATDLLRTTLQDAGIANPKVEVTGIRQAPLINGDAYLQHARTCYVLSGAQFDMEGRYTWYLSGP
jgi:hypothetical protein